MQTLIPIGTFEGKARGLLGDAGFDDMLEFLARRPKAGRVIVGTGGLRKVRIARPGGGKSAGTRVIYYYHNETIPLFLLTVFGKNEKANISPAERNDLAKLTNLLQKHYGDKNE